MIRYLTTALMLAALAGGCRAVADHRIYPQNPQPIPRHCNTVEDRQMPSGVCVRRPVETYDHIWRKDRKYPWIAGGNPQAREFFDREERYYGGHSE